MKFFITSGLGLTPLTLFLIITLSKNLKVCQNHITISLISYPSKVTLKIIFNRLKNRRVQSQKELNTTNLQGKNLICIKTSLAIFLPFFHRMFKTSINNISIFLAICANTIDVLRLRIINTISVSTTCRPDERQCEIMADNKIGIAQVHALINMFPQNPHLTLWMNIWKNIHWWQNYEYAVGSVDIHANAEEE